MDGHLAVFLAVARAGRLSAAARRLNRAVSSVSQQIASLEGDFGARLLVRTNRGVALTPAGTTLVGYAEAIETERRQALRAVRRATSGAAAVHLAVSQTACEVFRPPPLGRFGRGRADVRATVTMANSAAVLAQGGERSGGLRPGRGPAGDA